VSAQYQPGQLLFAGFEGLNLPDDLARLIADGRVGGVILFARNIADPEQTRSLTAALHACAPQDTPLLIAIDQEGGRVQRLRAPWTEWPPMRRLGECEDPSMTESVARALALELSDLDIGLDFAPCADVDTNPDNPIIGDRSFGRDAKQVALHTSRFVRAMQSAGVAACAKHFPGHGDTACDSHNELPRLDHSLARIREVELPPFAAAVDAEVASIMTAHIMFPSLDRVRPATLSPDIMALLREDLAFDGVVMSDDLEMKAIADHYSPQKIVEGGLEAGVDVFLVCRQAALRDEVLHRLERARDVYLEPALRRVEELKARYGGPKKREPVEEAEPTPPYRAHRAIAARFA
jgi:beta-N-acetylhexosaminidase